MPDALMTKGPGNSGWLAQCGRLMEPCLRVARDVSRLARNRLCGAGSIIDRNSGNFAGVRKEMPLTYDSAFVFARTRR